MIVVSLVSSALRIFKRNAKRTLLTLLGTVVGTAILVVVFSLGEGFRMFALSQLSTLSPQNIYLEVKAPSSVNPRGEGSVLSALSIDTLDQKDADDIEKIPGVDAVMGWINGQEKVSHEGENKTVTVFAVGEQYDEMMAVDIEFGRFFTKEENEGLRQVIVLGSDIADHLSPKGKELLLEQNIRVGGRSFRVVGIAEELGSIGFLDQNEVVMLPVYTAQKKMWGKDYFQAMIIEVNALDLIPRVSRAIERIMYKNHDIDGPDEEDYRLTTYDQVMDIVGVVLGGINVLLIALASISLVVGGVGIMNVMYVTVTERTKEIGLRKSLGASPRAILVQFLIESVLITLFGGILGAFLGLGLSYIMSVGAQSVGISFVFVFSWSSIGIAVLVAVSLGFLFGFAPARKAAQLDPIISLRSD